MANQEKLPETWDGYGRLVLHRLDDLGDRFEDMEKQNRDDHAKVMNEITELKVSMGSLKVKSSAWGVVGGMLAGLMIYVKQILGIGSA